MQITWCKDVSYLTIFLINLPHKFHTMATKLTLESIIPTILNLLTYTQYIIGDVTYICMDIPY